jgi:hypothetical protein
MNAFDTTNLRLSFTARSNLVLVRMRTNLSGATTMPQVLLGVLDGSTVKGRQVPLGALPGTALATTNIPLVAEFVVTTTSGTAYNWDAAGSVQTPIAATNIHYGGPNNTGSNNAWGGFAFEIWNPIAYIPSTIVTNNDKAGYGLSTPQNFDMVGNISGTFVGNIRGSVANVTGSVGGVFGLTPSLLDVAVSSRMASGTVTVGTNNDKTGYLLSGTSTDPWLTSLPGAYGAGTAGFIVGTNIDVRTSSRMASGTVVSSVVQGGTVTVSGTVTAAVASVPIVGMVTGSVGSMVGLTPSLLDVAVSSRMASGTVVVGTNNDKTNYQLLNNQVVNFSGTITNVFNVLNPVTAVQITGAVNVIGLNPALLDVAVSSRMASGTVVVGTNNDKTNYQLANNQVINISGTITNVMNVLNPVTAGLNTGTFIQAVVNGVWNEQISSHLITGSTGKSLNSASSAGDPWGTALPGVYGAGTAGNILGNNLDVTVSSRLASGTYTTPPTASQISTQVLNDAAANPIKSDVKKVNSTTIKGDGNATPWGPV